MFCENCGKSIPDSVKFCPFCGAKIEAAVDEQAGGAGGAQPSQQTWQQPQPGGQPYQQPQPGQQTWQQPQPGGQPYQQAQPGGQPYQQPWNATPTAAYGQQPGRSGSKTAIIIIAVVLALAAIGAGVYFFFFRDASGGSGQAGGATKAAEAASDPYTAEAPATKAPEADPPFTLAPATEPPATEPPAEEPSTTAPVQVTDIYSMPEPYDFDWFIADVNEGRPSDSVPVTDLKTLTGRWKVVITYLEGDETADYFDIVAEELCVGEINTDGTSFSMTLSPISILYDDQDGWQPESGFTYDCTGNSQADGTVYMTGSLGAVTLSEFYYADSCQRVVGVVVLPSGEYAYIGFTRP